MNELRANIKAFNKHFKPVAFTHVATLINAIFFSVIVLLVVFGEYHEALFISIVVVFNIFVGIVQDMRAKLSLEKLQILMAPRVLRLGADGAYSRIELEDVKNGDLLKIDLGDQIPTDGVIVESDGLEVNEALLTGESGNVIKPQNAKVLGGSFATAGSGIMRAEVSVEGSYVSLMTEKIKHYSYVLSPIQRTLTSFIRYMSFLLLGVIAFVTFQGITKDTLVVTIVKNIAALTSTLVPQGLILATTIFFAYGALQLFKKKVLLQEINAIEKLGLIKNLCIDKTGTLTENQPQVEDVLYFDKIESEYVRKLLSGYLQKNGHTSQTAVALENYCPSGYAGEIGNFIAFSSDKKFGAVELMIDNNKETVVLGAPDILVNSVVNESAKVWITENAQKLASDAKRLVLLGVSEVFSDRLDGLRIEPVALIVLSNPLRSGTREIIEFFQNRGVRIRVISGDHPATVQAIAMQAGIKHTDMYITGPEMEGWDDDAYEERVPAYHVFARIHPDQKEKIVKQLKFSGFTAMVGDGANDALAIKQADLGIAMFDGSGATRQIAQIVLMNNSFAVLPTGVGLAEKIITNIELVASVYFYKVVTGFLLFASLATMGYIYPLSPRNDTIIGYATVWIAILVWTLFPARRVGLDTKRSLFKKIFPFAITAGVVTATASVIVFSLGPQNLHYTGSNAYVVMVLMALGYWFIYLSPIAYGVEVDLKQKKLLVVTGIILLILLISVILNSTLARFFDFRSVHIAPLGITVLVVLVFGWIQYFLTFRFFRPPQVPKPNDFIIKEN